MVEGSSKGPVVPAPELPMDEIRFTEEGGQPALNLVGRNRGKLHVIPEESLELLHPGDPIVDERFA